MAEEQKAVSVFNLWLGDDVPDNLEVNGFEYTISGDTPLVGVQEPAKRLKVSVNRTVLTESYFERSSLCR